MTPKIESVKLKFYLDLIKVKNITLWKIPLKNTKIKTVSDKNEIKLEFDNKRTMKSEDIWKQILNKEIVFKVNKYFKHIKN